MMWVIYEYICSKQVDVGGRKSSRIKEAKKAEETKCDREQEKERLKDEGRGRRTSKKPSRKGMRETVL